MTPTLKTRPHDKSHRIFYGWWLTGIAALVMVVGTVPVFQGMPVWFVVLERNFGWSRAQLSLAFSLTRVEGTIMGPISGYLIDRLGPRRMVTIGLLLIGIGFLLFSRIHNLWQFYVAFIIMTSGMGLGTWLPMMTVLNNWFIKHRSTAMAIAMEGFAFGGIVIIPILAWTLDEKNVGFDGWRYTALAIGVAVIILSVPISRLIRNRPEDYGLLPKGLVKNDIPSSTEILNDAHDQGDYTWKQAIRTRAFWLISMGHASTAAIVVTLMVHLGTMLTDRGFSLQTIGWVVATQTGVTALFNLVGGYVGDKIPMRVALFVFSVIQTIGLIILLFAYTTPMAYMFAIVYGIGWGGRAPLTTAIRGVYFGRKAFASITGFSMIPMNILHLIAPLFAGIMFDITRSYTIPFSAIAVVSFIGSVLFLMLGNPQKLTSTD